MTIRTITTLAPILVWTLTVGCSGATQSPISPQPERTPQAIPLPAPSTPQVMANLKLSHVAVVVLAEDHDGKRTYSYVPTFRVTETSGVSAATIIGVEVAVAGGELQRVDEKCVAAVRVGAGASSDAFNADWWEGLLYCMPDFTSTEPVPFVSIGVSFKDDAGTWGSVSARIDIN
jgi:hypothetical protein